MVGVSTSDRWPARVYAEGEEPDYRFSLANERTFLSWLRTSLALIAAGVAIDVFDLGVSDTVVRLLSLGLLGTGVIAPVLAWWRWASAERAMRHHEPLPPLGATAALITGVVLLAAAALTLVAVAT